MRFTFRFRVGEGFGPAAGLLPGAEFHACVRSTKPVGPAISSPVIGPNALTVRSRERKGAS
jgi:hypothetical protein